MIKCIINPTYAEFVLVNTEKILLLDQFLQVSTGIYS